MFIEIVSVCAVLVVMCGVVGDGCDFVGCFWVVLSVSRLVVVMCWVPSFLVFFCLLGVGALFSKLSTVMILMAWRSN